MSEASLEILLQENRKLKRAVEELSILNDLATTIGASLNSEEIMNKIVRQSLKSVAAEQGVITLLDKKNVNPMKTLVRDITSSIDKQPYHLHQNLLGWMQINKKALLIDDLRSDERFKGIQWDESIQSLVCVPLIIKAELIGILTVYNKKQNLNFTEEDQRLLSIIAAQSAQVIENARLYEEEKALLEMKEEIRLAVMIQQNLLPKENPQIPGYSIAGKSIPAQQVGGDYFDFIPIDEQRMGLCLGDVSGKGLPAAFLMANLQATIRSQTFSNLPIKDCIHRSNKLLTHNTDLGKFVTLFYGMLDTNKNELCYTNAGHDNPFLIINENNILRLKTGGIVLGFQDPIDYDEETIPFQPGSLLVVYSDGITEAMNEREEEFGDRAILDVILANRAASADHICDCILNSARQYSKHRPQMDDMTIVVIKREPAI